MRAVLIASWAVYFRPTEAIGGRILLEFIKQSIRAW